MSNKKFNQVLLIYDVSDAKRRKKLIKILESYGNRVQKSAFELELKGNEKKKVIKEIRAAIDTEIDNIRIYSIFKSAIPEQIGKPLAKYNTQTVALII